MPFCSNCGRKISDTAKFCEACGTATSKDATSNQREFVYEGSIHKCPNCGETIDAFNAKCPSCGFELNGKKVSSVLRDFVNGINECERNIANSSAVRKSSWSSWSKGKRFWWVVLNLFFLCVPLVIYLTLPLITVKFTPKLTSEEKRMTSLIENFPFPNDRESVLAALVYTKEKIDFISKEKIDRKSAYWMRLWCAKAEQLKQKADLLFPNDSIAKDCHKEIVADKARVKQTIRIKAILGLVILVIAFVFTVLLYSGNLGATNSNTNKATFEWLETGLSTKIPILDSHNGQIETNSDTELWIRLEDVTYKEFDQYVSSCKEYGYTVDAVKKTSGYEAYNAQGYYLDIYLWSNTKGSFDIRLNAPLTGDPNFKWPDNGLAEMLPVLAGKTGDAKIGDEEVNITLYDVTIDEFNAYCSSCEDSGFNVDIKKDHNSFEAYASRGYKVNIFIGEMKSMSITIKPPMEFSKISWPTTGAASLIPKPPSKKGNISLDLGYTFSVYISEMTIDDFNDYVDKCIDAGFETNYRFDTSFSAKKGKDISLSVHYNGYNTVYIDITNYNEF